MNFKNVFFSAILATTTLGAYAGAPTQEQDTGKPEQTAEQGKPEAKPEAPEAKPAEVQQEKPVLEKPVVEEKPVIQQEKPVIEKPVQEQMQAQDFDRTERLQGGQGASVDVQL